MLRSAANETAFAAHVARELLGPNASTDHAPPMMASEDFACMLQGRPGCLLRLGNRKGSSPAHHPCYDFDDAACHNGGLQPDAGVGQTALLENTDEHRRLPEVQGAGRSTRLPQPFR